MVAESDVYRWLMEAVKLRTRVDTISAIHVSEVVGCLRKAYYYRTRVLQISPSNALKLLGNGVHEALQEVLRRYGYQTEFPVALDLEDFKLVGHIDAYHPEENIVLEFKTTSKIPNDKPYESHLKQAQIYKVMAGAKAAYIIYIDRSGGRVKVFKAEDNKSVLKTAVERAKQLREALIKRVPPNRERGPYCSQCEFKMYCLGTLA